MVSTLVIVIFLVFITATSHAKYNEDEPPYCTKLVKDTVSYENNYPFDYDLAYIIPGQRQAYQKLYCINPPAVNKAGTTVCDWAAPPLVHFTIGDHYLYVVRQDPSGIFAGNAVIKTYQHCGHDTWSDLVNRTASPNVNSPL